MRDFPQSPYILISNTHPHSSPLRRPRPRRLWRNRPPHRPALIPFTTTSTGPTNPPQILPPHQSQITARPRPLPRPPSTRRHPHRSLPAPRPRTTRPGSNDRSPESKSPPHRCSHRRVPARWTAGAASRPRYKLPGGIWCVEPAGQEGRSAVCTGEPFS